MKRSRELLVGVSLTVGLALGATACGSSKPNTDHASKPVSKQRAIALVPNMRGFLERGSTTTCLNGGARPCAILIRTKPELSSDYINANPTQRRISWPPQRRISWPLEDYHGKGNNPVSIVCYDPSGEIVRPYEGNSSSTDWYKVAVPDQHIRNPAVTTELEQGDPAIHKAILNGKPAILGWASIEWFHQSTPDTQVSRC